MQAIIMAMPASQREEAFSAIQTLTALGFFEALARAELDAASNQLTSILEHSDSDKLKFIAEHGMRIRVFQGLDQESKQILAKLEDSNGETK